MPEKKTAVSFDLDGVLFPRIPIQLEAFKPWSYNKPLRPKHNPIYIADRIPQNHPLSLLEQAVMQLHAKRFVKSNIAEKIRQIHADIKIGNTGRSNNLAMVNLTWERLRQGKVSDEFKYINFKPDGISSDESKYWGLVELKNMGYANVIHYDDSARTVKRLAKVLPDIRFVIVQDLTSGILFSRLEMQKYPNVARIAKLKF
ncbi:MAG: hypothetical protein Q8P29_00530 [Candidatus Levybacteria bacterium]|nr:hypothetical protein [Candidatus Levybacteria bacterium]MDZ4228541.1 hypothetical protein [Candidatus Levybacteria bacterium]